MDCGLIHHFFFRSHHFMRKPRCGATWLSNPLFVWGVRLRRKTQTVNRRDYRTLVLVSLSETVPIASRLLPLSFATIAPSLWESAATGHRILAFPRAVERYNIALSGLSAVLRMSLKSPLSRNDVVIPVRPWLYDSSTRRGVKALQPR